MKAETLAELSGLSPRSIGRAESGHHLPNELSLAQIARAFGVSISVFDPIDEQALRKQIEETTRKTVMLPVTPLEDPAEAMAFIGGGHACQHDLSEVRGAEALDAAVALVQSFMDAGEIWDDIPLGVRLDLARDLVEQAQALLALGCKTLVGSYRARHLGAKNLTSPRSSSSSCRRSIRRPTPWSLCPPSWKPCPRTAYPCPPPPAQPRAKTLHSAHDEFGRLPAGRDGRSFLCSTPDSPA